MVSYSKSKPQEFRIAGITHEDILGNIGVEAAIDVGVFKQETDGWLMDVYVETEFRHNGLGRKLVEDFHSVCRKLGLKRVLCIVSSSEGRRADLEKCYRDDLGYRIEEHYDGRFPVVFGIKDL